MGTTTKVTDTALTSQITAPVAVEPSIVDVVLNTSGAQTGLAGADLQVGIYHELALDFNFTGFTGGSSPTIAVKVTRKGADGVYYSIASPAALNAAGTVSLSIGANLTTNVSFGDIIQASVTVTGSPTNAPWTLSIKGKQAV